jgi:deoxyribodipyrimidine photo-lyase
MSQTVSHKENAAIFIFHRDLRIYDNTALIKAIKECTKVYPVFILNPEQIDPSKNPYFSANGFHFMLESLIELKKELKITILNGFNTLPTLCREYDIKKLYFNRDYTPFALQREEFYVEMCKKNNIDIVSCDDIVLNAPTEIKAYQKYTPYYAIASSIKVRTCIAAPSLKTCAKLGNKSVDLVAVAKRIIAQTSPEKQSGGRKEALRLLHDAASNLPHKYIKTRDTMSLNTSRLSPHLKFGTISPREAYFTVADSNWRRQLYWRDFYLQLSYHFPHVLKAASTASKSLRSIPKYWRGGKSQMERFKEWCEGKTGCPMVDAGMRQLLITGWQHNRVRMITSSYLVKNLNLDWTLGERYFAQKLTDYDPANNSGGWQFAIGMDAMPFYRKFSPAEQTKKYDPECKYIKKWCPEYEKYNPKEIIKICQLMT